jgi:hypothetical protein
MQMAGMWTDERTGATRIEVQLARHMPTAMPKEVIKNNFFMMSALLLRKDN